jgi:hypothetical protein
MAPITNMPGATMSGFITPVAVGPAALVAAVPSTPASLLLPSDSASKKG